MDGLCARLIQNSAIFALLMVFRQLFIRKTAIFELLLRLDQPLIEKSPIFPITDQGSYRLRAKITEYR